MSTTYGWAKYVNKEHCAVNPDDTGRMLCGREVGYLPEFQGAFDPGRLHHACREVLDGRGLDPAPVLMPAAVYGTCPACVGDVEVRDGVCVPHGQHLWQDGRWLVSETQCDGAGLKPEVEP